MKTALTFTTPAPLSQKHAMAFWEIASEFLREGSCRYSVVFDADASGEDVLAVASGAVETVGRVLAGFGISQFEVEAVFVDRNG